MLYLRPSAAPEKSGVADRFRVLSALDQLDQLAGAFDVAGVNWVLVKGVGLGLSAWPDPFARPFSDLDVFVVPAHFGRAVQTLGRLGYRTGALPDASQVHWTFEREASLPVELHHVFSREFDSPRALVDRFVRTCVPIATGGAGPDLRVPAPAAHLAYVLLHAYNHGWQMSPGWALDVLWLLDRATADLHEALSFFPRAWPVTLSLHVAAQVVPALSAVLDGTPSLTLRERALLGIITARLDRAGMTGFDSALRRVGASPSPLATLLSMASRRA